MCPWVIKKAVHRTGKYWVTYLFRWHFHYWKVTELLGSIGRTAASSHVNTPCGTQLLKVFFSTKKFIFFFMYNGFMSWLMVFLSLSVHLLNSKILCLLPLPHNKGTAGILCGLFTSIGPLSPGIRWRGFTSWIASYSLANQLLKCNFPPGCKCIVSVTFWYKLTDG
jgi:hypothetical protein